VINPQRPSFMDAFASTNEGPLAEEGIRKIGAASGSADYQSVSHSTTRPPLLRRSAWSIPAQEGRESRSKKASFDLLDSKHCCPAVLAARTGLRSCVNVR